MARWGRADFRQLERLRDKIDRMAKADIDKLSEKAVKELAARMLAKVIKRTPVGQYPSETGKKGGTLRRGWTANSEREAELTAVFGGGTGANKYADSLQVRKNGDVYEIEIVNPVSYASYVEYGHRTANHGGWVPGQFFMTISAKEIDEASPAIVEKIILRHLKEVFNGD